MMTAPNVYTGLWIGGSLIYPHRSLEVAMHGSWFDTWTRRRFGLATGGAVASLLGVAVRFDAEAKKKKTRCRKVKQRCRRGSKRKGCCKGLHCREVAFQSGRHCCRGLRERCQSGTECCGELLCDEVDQFEGPRCCGDLGAPCQDNQDCCGNVFTFCNTLNQCDAV
jgi:hypothetical protein